MGGETDSGGETATAVIDMDRITRTMEGASPPSQEEPLVEGRSDLVENVTTFNQFDPSRASISNAECDDGNRFGSVMKNKKTGEKYDPIARKMRNEIVRAHMFKQEQVPSELRSMSEDSVMVLYTSLVNSSWFPSPDQKYLA